MTDLSLRVGEDGVSRCAWVGADVEYARYHDEEWGVELHGDRALFEKITLEAFQSGLSWITILRRRDSFRRAFQEFEWSRIAAYDSHDIERLMNDKSIIRNRAKIAATISNAQILSDWLSTQPGGLDQLVWSHRQPPRAVQPASLAEIPAHTKQSHALASALKQRGLRFVGPTTAYALMQSAGLVNDHVYGCFTTT